MSGNLVVWNDKSKSYEQQYKNAGFKGFPMQVHYKDVYSEH